MARAERRSFDWAAIEDDLGLRLPSDYELLAESFPAGWFRGWVWLRLPEETGDGLARLPGDFAAGQLDALREFRETRHSYGRSGLSGGSRRWSWTG